MICDIIQVYKFKYYQSKPGPFVITFYNEDIDRQNYKLYAYLKSIERQFNDIPLMRFNYKEFTKRYMDEKILSPDHLLIIENSETIKLIDTTDFNSIPEIFRRVREKRLSNKYKCDKYFKNEKRFKMRPFIVNGARSRISDINKLLDLSAESQYKFPNCTAEFNSNKEKLIKNKLLLSQKFLNSKIREYQTKLMLNDEDKAINKSKITIPVFSNFIKFPQKPEPYSNIQLSSKYINIFNQSLENSTMENKFNNEPIIGNCSILDSKFYNRVDTPLKSLKTNFNQPINKKTVILNQMVPQNPISSVINRNDVISNPVLTEHPTIITQDKSRKIHNLNNNLFGNLKNTKNSFVKDAYNLNYIYNLSNALPRIGGENLKDSQQRGNS